MPLRLNKIRRRKKGSAVLRSLLAWLVLVVHVLAWARLYLLLSQLLRNQRPLHLSLSRMRKWPCRTQR
jgi:sensor domain CHASE-containing protein